MPRKKYGMKVGYKIRSARELSGLSQEDLAEHIGKSVKQLSSYENGHNLPNIIVIYRIAVATNQSVNYFVPDACLIINQ